MALPLPRSFPDPTVFLGPLGTTGGLWDNQSVKHIWRLPPCAPLPNKIMRQCSYEHLSVLFCYVLLFDSSSGGEASHKKLRTHVATVHSNVEANV